MSVRKHLVSGSELGIAVVCAGGWGAQLLSAQQPRGVVAALKLEKPSVVPASQTQG